MIQDFRGPLGGVLGTYKRVVSAGPMPAHTCRLVYDTAHTCRLVCYGLAELVHPVPLPSNTRLTPPIEKLFRCNSSNVNVQWRAARRSARPSSPKFATCHFQAFKVFKGFYGFQPFKHTSCPRTAPPPHRRRSSSLLPRAPRRAHKPRRRPRTALDLKQVRRPRTAPHGPAAVSPIINK